MRYSSNCKMLETIPTLRIPRKPTRQAAMQFATISRSKIETNWIKSIGSAKSISHFVNKLLIKYFPPSPLSEKCQSAISAARLSPPLVNSIQMIRNHLRRCLQAVRQHPPSHAPSPAPPSPRRLLTHWLIRVIFLSHLWGDSPRPIPSTRVEPSKPP